MTIKWENYLWERQVLLSDSKLNAIETEMGIHFPEDYKNIIKLHQGQSPEPSCFKFHNNVNVFNSLLHFVEGEYESSNIAQRYETAKEFLPGKIVPFADTPGGDMLCFDFGEGTPSVVFASHELSGDDAIFPVAESFSIFLEMLYEDE